MKLKLSLIVSTILLFSVILIPTTALAEETDVQLAQETGQNWLNIISTHNTELPDWREAQVVLPQTYYDLKGNIIAYQFSMVNKTRTVGNILVGGSSEEYHVIRASESAPPTTPSTEEVRLSLNNLGIRINSHEIKEPLRFIYTGLDGQYALYEIKGNTIAVNLFTKKAVLLSELEAATQKKNDYINQRNLSSEPLDSTRSTGFAYLNMTAYSGLCGPASGVSIGRYYRDEKGYSYIYGDTTLYYQLYINMHCSQYDGAAMPWLYGDGFEDTMENCDYYNFDHTYDSSVNEADYWNVVSNIDNEDPVALCLVTEWHWRAIRGYDYVTAPYNWYYVYCTNSLTEDDWELLEWEDVVDAWAYTVSIHD